MGERLPISLDHEIVFAHTRGVYERWTLGAVAALTLVSYFTPEIIYLATNKKVDLRPFRSFLCCCAPFGASVVTALLSRKIIDLEKRWISNSLNRNIKLN